MHIIAAPGDGGEREPSTAELAEIEAEWPEIEAELAWLDQEINDISGSYLEMDDLVWRRNRRLARQVLTGQRREAREVRAETVYGRRGQRRGAAA